MSRLTTVADLRAALADLPDWALVEVVSYDDDGTAEPCDLRIDYSRGVLSIDAA